MHLLSILKYLIDKKLFFDEIKVKFVDFLLPSAVNYFICGGINHKFYCSRLKIFQNEDSGTKVPKKKKRQILSPFSGALSSNSN